MRMLILIGVCVGIFFLHSQLDMIFFCKILSEKGIPQNNTFLINQYMIYIYIYWMSGYPMKPSNVTHQVYTLIWSWTYKEMWKTYGETLGQGFSTSMLVYRRLTYGWWSFPFVGMVYGDNGICPSVIGDSICFHHGNYSGMTDKCWLAFFSAVTLSRLLGIIVKGYG